MKKYPEDESKTVSLRKDELTSQLYENFFPKEREDTKELLSERSLDTWYERVDYQRAGKFLLYGSWFPVLAGIGCALLIYSFMPQIYPQSNNYEAQVSLLYKRVKKNAEAMPIATVKDMITMPNNCQGVKTLLGIDGTVEEIQDRSRVETKRNSNLLELTVEAASPEEAVNLANTFAEVAYNNNKKFYESKAKALIAKSEKLLRQSNADAIQARQAFINFKKRNNLVDIDFTKKSLLESVWNSKLEKDELERQLATLIKEQSYLIELSKEEPNQIALPDQNKLELRQELAAAQTLYIELKVEYADQNPRIIGLKKKIESLKEAIGNGVLQAGVQPGIIPRPENIEAELNRKSTDISDVKLQLSDLEKTMAQRSQALKNFPLLQQEFNQLSNQQETNDALVEFHEEALRNARMEFIRPHTDFEVYELASDAVGKDRNTRKIVSAAMGFGGLFLAYSLLFSMHLVSNKIKTSKELKLNYKIPWLVSIPIFKEKQLKMLNSPLTKYVQRLSEKIALKAKGEGKLSLAVCSVKKGAGKSSLALEMARYYSQIGLKTVYLDFDYLGKNYFEHTSNITDLLHLQENFAVNEILEEKNNLTMVKFDQHPAMYERVKSIACQRFIHSLKDRYHVVIIDCPGINEESYASNIIKLADNSLFIVKSGETGRSELDEAMHKLEDMNIEPLGFVLNCSEEGEY